MILLDTHTLIWTASDPKRLSREAYRTIERAAASNAIAIAAISLWEIAWLLQNNRLRTRGTVRQTLTEYVTRTRSQVLDLSAEIAVVAAQLPESVPGDPADRLVVATALVHAIPLVTKDARIQDSRTCKTVW